jgi:hypothetical protein
VLVVLHPCLAKVFTGPLLRHCSRADVPHLLPCAAIWQGMASTDVIRKIFGIYLPVAYFIIGGFEHCVANQYLLYQVSFRVSPVQYAQNSRNFLRFFMRGGAGFTFINIPRVGGTLEPFVKRRLYELAASPLESSGTRLKGGQLRPGEDLQTSGETVRSCAVGPRGGINGVSQGEALK